MTKQAVIYARFSPRPNAEQCLSCEKQEERCRAHCQRKGYEVAGVFYDKDVTGGILSRPGLQDALTAIGEGTVFIVDSSDRLARDMLVSLTIRHEVDKAGGVIEFADGSPTNSTPEGELFANILAAFAAYERARIRYRTSRGLKRRQAAGEWFGKPPVGWQRDPDNSKALIRNEDEQAAIAWAIELRKWGMRSDRIAAHLTADADLLRGRPWSGRTVRKILKMQGEMKIYQTAGCE